MKIILLFCLLISFAHAQDAVQCAKRAVNYSLALKMRAALSAQIHRLAQEDQKPKDENYDPYNDSKISPESVCNVKAIPDYDDVRKQKELSLKLLTEEINKKGKVSKTFAAGIDENAEKDMTPKEFCDSLSKRVDDNSDFSLPNGKCADVAKDVHKSFVTQNLLSKTYQESCKVMLPIVKAARNRMLDCEKNLDDPKKEEVAIKEEKKKNPESKKQSPLERKTFKYLSPGSSSSAQ